MDEENNEEIILPNIVKEEPVEQETIKNKTFDKINIPSWDLTPPMDSIDRGQMN